MSQYVVYAVLSYLTLVPMAWCLHVSLRPARFRVAGVVADFIPADTDHGGLC